MTPHLTPREQDTLHCLAQGMSTKDIAAELGITERAAKHHTDYLRAKFGVSHRRHLIPLASRALAGEREAIRDRIQRAKENAS